MNKMEIEIPAGKTAVWKEVNGQQVLVLVDKKKEEEKRPVTERVKTFKDACRELGEKHHFVREYKAANKLITGDLLAYLKLRIITAALNEGWEPQFVKGEWRWFPCFSLWTDEELSELSDEWKRQYVLEGLANYQGGFAGFACADSIYAPSSTLAYIGSRLCYKSEALADYSGRQFADLWADFYLIRK